MSDFQPFHPDRTVVYQPKGLGFWELTIKENGTVKFSPLSDCCLLPKSVPHCFHCQMYLRHNEENYSWEKAETFSVTYYFGTVNSAVPEQLNSYVQGVTQPYEALVRASELYSELIDIATEMWGAEYDDAS